MPIEKKLLKKLLRELKKGLPYGSSLVIRERLIAKYGEDGPFSLSNVRAVLSPEDPRYNEQIIEEAVIYRDEVKAANLRLQSRIGVCQ